MSIKIIGELSPTFSEILTPAALALLLKLERQFGVRRRELLAAREARQVQIDAGELPDFLPASAEIRNSDWTVAPIPTDLQDRRVEITGPVDRKMVINALNSGANVFMADFEDSHAPTWAGTIEGQINLRDAVNRTITFEHPTKNKTYRLNETIATLLVRPRGWHLEEKHVLVDDRPMSAALFDFGLYLFHNAKTLLANGSGPYFYLPKLESHLEARLWNDAFNLAQAEISIPQGTIRATVLIETILATFELDEILYELRDHSAGLNCGRWDYIFSAIKKLRNHPQFTFPNRAQVTMTSHMMHAYSQLVIKTCHRRGIHAMGGMAAQIPIKNDPEANDRALEKVRQDKVREAQNGHDGTWVAHPGLVPIAKAVFDEFMPTPHQIHVKREDVQVTAADILHVPQGHITQEGFLTNIDVGLQYIESWLRGVGCVPIYNLMEDAATAEISRSQLWQWVHSPSARLADGREVTPELYQELLPVAVARTASAVGETRFAAGKFAEAQTLLSKLVLNNEFTEFLTLPAYEQLS
ncbi:MAG: malate synthase A [Candidatus Promineifilaceae bacterium]